ncbi:hypothetical protein [Undibacterium sp. Xuan67W]|uniref:hypothetical protein n=1 Tax=Undibacterium sp. Xuan67W TaxID=3413057 RepID=UPI003BF203FB
MKNLILISVISTLSTLGTANANAAGHVGQCVFPKTKSIKKNQLDFKNPVYVLSAPNATDGQLLKTLTAFSIKAESNGLIQLVTVPDYSQDAPEKSAGKVIGWAKLADFDFQDQRNCN